MKPYEYKLAAYLLKLASDEFSNHGCNDLDLRDAGLSKQEYLDFQKQSTEPGEEVPRGSFTMDWLAMAHLAFRLEEEARG